MKFPGGKREPEAPPPIPTNPLMVPGSRTPKATVRILAGRGYQASGIRQLLPHLALADIEAVLAEKEA